LKHNAPNQQVSTFSKELSVSGEPATQLISGVDGVGKPFLSTAFPAIWFFDQPLARTFRLLRQVSIIASAVAW
jgi:hypothetical protein